MIPHLASEQDAALSIYSSGERYVSASTYALAVAESVQASILDGESASATDATLRTARAAEREADPAQHVAAVSLPVVTAQGDTADSD